MFWGCTGVEARAIGKIMAMVLANNMPGHLIEPGKLSEIQELLRVATMPMMLIPRGMMLISGTEKRGGLPLTL